MNAHPLLHLAHRRSQPTSDPIAPAVENVMQRLAYFSVLTPIQQEQKARGYAAEIVKAVLALTRSVQ